MAKQYDVENIEGSFDHLVSRFEDWLSSEPDIAVTQVRINPEHTGATIKIVKAGVGKMLVNLQREWATSVASLPEQETKEAAEKAGFEYLGQEDRPFPPTPDR